jgi:hypothetical protein
MQHTPNELPMQNKCTPHYKTRTFLTQTVVTIQYITLILPFIHNFLPPPILRMSPSPHQTFVVIERIVRRRSRRIGRRGGAIQPPGGRSTRSRRLMNHLFWLQSNIRGSFIVVTGGSSSVVIVAVAGSNARSDFIVSGRNAAVGNTTGHAGRTGGRGFG